MTTFKGTAVKAEKGFKDVIFAKEVGPVAENHAVMCSTSPLIEITDNAVFETGCWLPANASIVDVMTFVMDAPTNAVNVQYGYEADPDAFVLDHPLGTTDNTIVSPRNIQPVVSNATTGVSSDLTGKADDWLSIGGSPDEDNTYQIYGKLSANPTTGADIRVRVLYTRPIA